MTAPDVARLVAWIDAGEACSCCTKPTTERDVSVTRGRMHFDCWADHHSGPELIWPPDHDCPAARRALVALAGDGDNA